MPDHYAVAADVNRYIQNAPVTASSVPNLTDLTQIIEDVAELIDASLANIGYVTPVVSGTISLNLLRRACAWGAVGMVIDTREAGTRSDYGKSGPNVWTQKFNEFIKKLTTAGDPFELPDAPRSKEQMFKQPEQILGNAFTDDANFTSGIGADPTMTMTKVL